MQKKFSKILIANRGEIACRVIRACRELDIRTVAVYSEADAKALHVRMADEAYLIGPPPSRESYLQINKIIETAKMAKAEAIHPGYGFLSESAEFAKAVNDSGLVFIGPPSSAIEAMGAKIAARQIAIRANVPVVPGTEDPLISLEQAQNVASAIGYPVMLKASAGGGGKGMRLVSDPDELKSAYDTARSEAMAAFGDDSIYLEKAIVRPRHVEIQVFADTFGNVVHLGERECSIQRRHQKVIEEAPSPINSAQLRELMGEAAVKVAKAVDYVGAGTVEFLVSGQDLSFYFLEMNTRLQVEHPVTELVTGIDLVREQIRVAEGLPLSFSQNDVKLRGHAIECRIYAENPEEGFVPSPGKIEQLKVPCGPWVRDDSGVFAGAEVSIFYDPMISKFAVWGRNRLEAIERMRRALKEYKITGIKTTIPFFQSVMDDEVFISGDLDTGFIEGFFKRQTQDQASKRPDKNDSFPSEIELIAAAVATVAKANDNATPLTTENYNLKQSKWKEAGRLGQLTNRK